MHTISFPVQDAEAIPRSTERVRRYRAKHRRIEFVPDDDVMKIINQYVSINPTQSLAEILDHLIREGHKSIVTGNA